MKEDKKNQFFARHMLDMADRAYQGSYPVFTDFLTTSEYMLLSSMQTQFRGIRTAYWGGHRDCDHVTAGFFPNDWPGTDSKMFPVVCIRVTPLNERYAQSLEHRDYLGAILNLGIERAKIGDIRICESTAYVFCKEEFASFVVENFITVKHTQITCQIMTASDELPEQQYSEKIDSVASVRLDNVVSAMAGISRSKAVELIRQGNVTAGHALRTAVSFMCTDEMIITIRGYGKFRLSIPENAFTRKGKQKIIIYKFL